MKTATAKKKKKKGMPDEQVEKYMPMVNSIASIVAGKGLPPTIDFNDLVSDGLVGLMKAWGTFDPKKKVKFETYASYRIRGEILDGLKIHNPVPYRVQVKIRDLAKGRFEEEEKKKKKEKKKLSEKEFSRAVGKVQKIVSASALMYLLSLEGLQEKGEVEIEGGATPAGDLEFAELQGRLWKAVEELPNLEKQVVLLFYSKDMNQRGISKELKLSPSKVNRLIGKAVTRLREKMILAQS